MSDSDQINTVDLLGAMQKGLSSDDVNMLCFYLRSADPRLKDYQDNVYQSLQLRIKGIVDTCDGRGAMNVLLDVLREHFSWVLGWLPNPGQGLIAEQHPQRTSDRRTVPAGSQQVISHDSSLSSEEPHPDVRGVKDVGSATEKLARYTLYGLLGAAIITGVVAIALKFIPDAKPGQDTPTPSITATLASPTPIPQVTPSPFVKDNITTGKALKTSQISLVEGELIVGTADRFQDGVTQATEPPFTAFLIRGPIQMDLTILDGGWDDWVNVYDNEFAESLLAQKELEVKQHPTYPQRGLQIARCARQDHPPCLVSIPLVRCHGATPPSPPNPHYNLMNPDHQPRINPPSYVII